MPLQRIPFFSHVYRQQKGTGINPNGTYLNPMKGFRKVSANQPPDCPCSDLQNQEVFDDGVPTCKTNSNCDHGCCPLNQKHVQHKNGKINYDYSYSHNIYLQSRCKTYFQNTFNYDLSGTYSRALGAGRCAPAPSAQPPCGTGYPCKRITYKPNNGQFSRQGAVSAANRLLRLNHNQKQIDKGTHKPYCAHPNPPCSLNYRLGKRCGP